jgi:hypothetical protein
MGTINPNKMETENTPQEESQDKALLRSVRYELQRVLMLDKDPMRKAGFKRTIDVPKETEKRLKSLVEKIKKHEKGELYAG